MHHETAAGANPLGNSGLTRPELRRGKTEQMLTKSSPTDRANRSPGNAGGSPHTGPGNAGSAPPPMHNTHILQAITSLQAAFCNTTRNMRGIDGAIVKHKSGKYS